MLVVVVVLVVLGEVFVAVVVWGVVVGATCVVTGGAWVGGATVVTGGAAVVAADAVSWCTAGFFFWRCGRLGSVLFLGGDEVLADVAAG